VEREGEGRVGKKGRQKEGSEREGRNVLPHVKQAVAAYANQTKTKDKITTARSRL